MSTINSIDEIFEELSYDETEELKIIERFYPRESWNIIPSWFNKKKWNLQDIRNRLAVEITWLLAVWACAFFDWRGSVIFSILAFWHYKTNSLFKYLSKQDILWFVAFRKKMLPIFLFLFFTFWSSCLFSLYMEKFHFFSYLLMIDCVLYKQLKIFYKIDVEPPKKKRLAEFWEYFKNIISELIWWNQKPEPVSI